MENTEEQQAQNITTSNNDLNQVINDAEIE